MLKEMNPNVKTAYQYLLNKILSFELMPGDHVVDNQIAKQLGISRSPVREAVLQLVADGMIHLSNGKLLITPINLNDIVDILHMRAALEVECLIIIAENNWLTHEQENKLRSIHERMVQSLDNTSFADHYAFDDAFHQEIISVANSLRISTVIQQMRLQMQRARWLNLSNPSRQVEATLEHERILEAILQHDLEAASFYMREHFKKSEAVFRKIANSKQMQMMLHAIDCFLN